jgi:hypothetical protein
VAHRQEIRVPGQPEPLSHYTDAVRGDVLKVTVFLTDVDDRARIGDRLRC